MRVYGDFSFLTESLVLQLSAKGFITITPVAKGSKVPAWPIVFTLKRFLKAATSQKEVLPLGLSTSRIPCGLSAGE